MVRKKKDFGLVNKPAAIDEEIPPAQIMVTSQQSSELGNEVPVEGRQIEQQAINPTATSKEISAEQPQQGILPAESGQQTEKLSSAQLSLALRDGDTQQISLFIHTINDDGEVTQILKELPSADVLSLLKYVDQQMQLQQLEAADLQRWLFWVRETVRLHSNFLTTVPNIGADIGHIYLWMEKRVRNMDKLLKLQGKLQFLLDTHPAGEAAGYVRTKKPMTLFMADR